MPNLSQQPDRPLGPLFGERSPDGESALGGSDPYMGPRGVVGHDGAITVSEMNYGPAGVFTPRAAAHQRWPEGYANGGQAPFVI